MTKVFLRVIKLQDQKKETLASNNGLKSDFLIPRLGKFIMQKIRPIVALSGDDRLTKSMQESRIYGRVDHTLDK